MLVLKYYARDRYSPKFAHKKAKAGALQRVDKIKKQIGEPMSHNFINPEPASRHFKKLASDIHDIRMDPFTPGLLKAMAIKKCIDSFASDSTTSLSDLRLVAKLMEQLYKSKERTDLLEAQRASGRNN
jgi:hypothetical protein